MVFRLWKISVSRTSSVQLPSDDVSNIIPFIIKARFTVGNNEISGGFPAEIGQMANLAVIWLFNNQLAGALPEEIADMTGLVVLDVIGNDFSGALPASIGSAVDLLVLNLGDNAFEGPIPEEYSNLVNLQQLNIEECSLTGVFPDFSGMQDLTVLRLGGNGFDQGTFPAYVYGMTGLVDLRLNGCGLSGNLDAAIANLVDLQVLSLHDNDLSGAIPGEISQLVSIEVLTLQGNTFQGDIPDISGMVGLREINLSDNEGPDGEVLLSGPIPDFSAFTSAERLEFRNCGLFGTLDPSITGITTLRKYCLGDLRFLSVCLLFRILNLFFLHSRRMARPGRQRIVRRTPAELGPDGELGTSVFEWQPIRWQHSRKLWKSPRSLGPKSGWKPARGPDPRNLYGHDCFESLALGFQCPYR